MEDLSVLEMVYVGCALLGGMLFVIRVILMFAGGDGHTDADATVADIHVDDMHLDDSGISDASFKILSLQGLTGFFMMFGLIGLAVVRSFESRSVGTVISILAGVAAGLFAVWVISKLFSLMSGMQSSGTLDLANAIGEEGSVYLRIPAEGTGKVQITIQGRLQEFEAVSEKKTELKTGERVKVVKVASGSVLSVERC